MRHHVYNDHNHKAQMLFLIKVCNDLDHIRAHNVYTTWTSWLKVNIAHTHTHTHAHTHTHTHTSSSSVTSTRLPHTAL